MNLDRLLAPRSVAIVGASADPKKISGIIIAFLEKSGYAGKVMPINPRYEKIGNLTCYPSVEALPETVDLLVCVVPVAVAFPAMEAAARRGVPYCLLMTGGFGEGRSGAQGLERLERLLALCRETGMKVVGPNTVGMVNFRQRLPLTFADWYGRDTGQRGGVVIVTNSGSVGGLIFSALQLNRIGVDYWFGLGNEANLEVADFINHFSADGEIHTVICYMEGVQNGRNFMVAADAARRAGKNVVVVKSGDNPESARSTLSHTGKNPSAGDIYQGVFRQLGVIQTASLSELGYVMTLLSTVGDRLGPRIGIISASGGACSLIADHIINAGLQLPELTEDLQAKLNLFIPEYASSRNPVDVSADVVSRPDILGGTLASLAEDRDVDVWIVFGRPIIDRYHEALATFADATGKAVIVSSGVPIAAEIEESLQDHKVAVLPDPELCMRAISAILRSRGVAGIEFAGADFNSLAVRGTGRLLDHTTAAAALAAHGLLVAAEARPALLVAIEEDRDFGAVLIVSAASPFVARARRVVRALPASSADLRDVVAELATVEGGLPASATVIVAALEAIVRLYLETPEFGAAALALGSVGVDQLVLCSA